MPTSGVPLPSKINAEVLALKKALWIIRTLGDGASGRHVHGLFYAGEGRRASDLINATGDCLYSTILVVAACEGGGCQDHANANAPTKFSTENEIIECKLADFSRGIRIRLDS